MNTTEHLLTLDKVDCTAIYWAEGYIKGHKYGYRCIGKCDGHKEHETEDGIRFLVDIYGNSLKTYDPRDKKETEVRAMDSEGNGNGRNMENPYATAEAAMKEVQNTKSDRDEITVNVPPNLLLDADNIIHGQRRDDYGGVTESFSQIAAYWNDYIARHLLRHYPTCLVEEQYPPQVLIQLTPEDVANLMILMKVSRAQNGFHRDSYVDIAGYAGCVEMIERGE